MWDGMEMEESTPVVNLEEIDETEEFDWLVYMHEAAKCGSREEILKKRHNKMIKRVCILASAIAAVCSVIITTIILSCKKRGK